MGFAAAGFIVPVAGALLQEAIDVAVILNALRALTDSRAGSLGAARAPGDLPAAWTRVESGSSAGSTGGMDVSF